MHIHLDPMTKLSLRRLTRSGLLVGSLRVGPSFVSRKGSPHIEEPLSAGNQKTHEGGLYSAVSFPP